MGNSKTRMRYMRHRQENYLFKMKYDVAAPSSPVKAS